MASSETDMSGNWTADDGETRSFKASCGCEAWMGHRVEDTEAGINTCRLHAAAPRLLAALREAADDIDTLLLLGRTVIDAHPDLDWNALCARRNAARAAIVQAEGKPAPYGG